MMAYSFSLVATGSPVRLQVHAASHSAGHTLDVKTAHKALRYSAKVPTVPKSPARDLVYITQPGFEK